MFVHLELVKNLLKAICFTLLRFSGLPFLIREAAQRRKVTIVVYHSLPADLAEVHFGILGSRYNIVSLSTYLSARASGSMNTLPSKSLIITFDDGHRNNYQLLPLLQKHEIPITIFLCSGIVGTRRHYWWSHAGSPSEAQKLKSLPDEQRVGALIEKGHADSKEYETRQALSWKEIAEMRNVVDFQSHTVFHPILPECSEQRAKREIIESKSFLEQHGLEIHGLAYPNGDYSDRDIRLLRNAGYVCGLTLKPGYNDAKTNLFCLRRVALPDDAGINELIVKTSGLWTFLKILSAGRKSRRASKRLTVDSGRPTIGFHSGATS